MSSPEYWLGRGGGFLGGLLGGLFQRGASKNYARPLDTLRTNSKYRKEMKELRSLWMRLDREPGALEQKQATLCQQVLMEASDSHSLSPQITDSITKLLTGCFTFEGTFTVPQTPGRELSIGEIWELRDSISRLVALVERPEVLNRLCGTLRTLIRTILPPTLPVNPSGRAATLTVPVYALLPDPALSIEGALRVFLSGDPQQSAFPKLAKMLEGNVFRVSGIDPARPGTHEKQVARPTDTKNAEPEELLDSYLAGTPLADYFRSKFSFSIPQSSRFEHTHIVGGSGHGKTQLLQNLILSDVSLLREGTASLIVIDSQGDMFRKVSSLQAVGEISDRVVLIDPTEIFSPPALNLFDFGLDRAAAYPPLEREMLVNGAISLYEYVFGALLGAELTARQGVVFRYLARLMMVVPGATIHTLMDFMQEPESTRPYLDNLTDDTMTRRFFDTQFFSKSFHDTRQQILTRLWGVLSNRVLERMFANKRNKLNLFTAMNRGSLILINTAKDLLKQEGCEILGRFFIALLCQAAQERASIPESKRMPTFVYIDEAHDYFDESMENLLNQARKYKVGLILAHQNLDQFETTLRSTVMASTSIKMVGGLSARDASVFSRDMRCEPEVLLSMRKDNTRSDFACFVRNLTERPIPLSVPLGAMEREPTLTAQALEAIKAQNRTRYCATTDNTPLPEAAQKREVSVRGETGAAVPEPEIL
jgi:hypothetical protein